MASVQCLSVIFLLLIIINSFLLCFILSYSAYARHRGDIDHVNCRNSRSKNIRTKRCSQCDKEQNQIIFLAAVIKNGILQCESTIINDFWVVTTSSCTSKIKRDTRATIFISAGSLEWQKGNRHFVRDVFDHENGLAKSKDSISLIKVHNPFDVYPEHLLGLQKEWRKFDFNSIQLYGWSEYRSLKGDFDGISNVECRLVYERLIGNLSLLNAFDDDVFCVNFCQYNIGNPLMMKDTLIAVSSQNNVECVDKFVPGMYIKISYYYGWIVEVINKN